MATDLEKQAERHTPAPWSLRERDVVFVPNVGTIAEAFGQANPVCEANAAFIVLACNSYGAMKAALEADTGALDEIRNLWAGHSEQCAHVLSKYKKDCDCDWPMIAARCDAALTNARAALELARGEKQPPHCSDCPPDGYPTDETRCAECPRRTQP